MVLSLKGKIALVTGGSRGAGRGIAFELALAGCKIYITVEVQEESLSRNMMI